MPQYLEISVGALDLRVDVEAYDELKGIAYIVLEELLECFGSVVITLGDVRGTLEEDETEDWYWIPNSTREPVLYRGQELLELVREE